MKKAILFISFCAIAISFSSCNEKKAESEVKKIEAKEAKTADSSKNSMVNDLNAQLGVDSTKKTGEKKAK